MTLDNATTGAYTCLHVVCPDRKGLVYDLMRTIKDVHLRVAFARVRYPTSLFGRVPALDLLPNYVGRLLQHKRHCVFEFQ